MEARHPHQHEARERIGAVVPTSGYDVVIETGGSESALQHAVEPARVGGTVVHLGLYEPGTASLFFAQIAVKCADTSQAPPVYRKQGS